MFSGVNKLFALLFAHVHNVIGRKSHKAQYLPKVEIKDYNVIFDGRNSFDQPIKIHVKVNENVRKIAAGQGGNQTTGCFPDQIKL